MTSRMTAPFGLISARPNVGPRLRMHDPENPGETSPGEIWRETRSRGGHSPSRNVDFQGPSSSSNIVQFPWMRREQRLGLPLLVRKAIERSRTISELDDDWDGEGSRGYTNDTINRAADVVRGIARRLSRPALDRLSVVELTPGPDGSIDIEVVVGEKRLLINAARDAESPILFYGHASNRSFPIEGEFNPTSSLRFLSEWLVA